MVSCNSCGYTINIGWECYYYRDSKVICMECQLAMDKEKEMQVPAKDVLSSEEEKALARSWELAQIRESKELAARAARFNSGKVDLTFNPKAAQLEWAKVWMYGAKKYERDQWKKLWGSDTLKVALASAQRHILEMLDGNMFDEESGQTHAGHVMCNMAMIIEYLAKQKLIDPEVYKENK